MFRWYNNDLPNVFDNMFKSVHNVHDHDTRQSSQLYCSPIKNNLGRTKLSYRAPFIWNQVIRKNINPDTSECVFSKAVKQCLKVGIL